MKYVVFPIVFEAESTQRAYEFHHRITLNTILYNVYAVENIVHMHAHVRWHTCASAYVTWGGHPPQCTVTAPVYIHVLWRDNTKLAALNHSLTFTTVTGIIIIHARHNPLYMYNIMFVNVEYALASPPRMHDCAHCTAWDGLAKGKSWETEIIQSRVWLHGGLRTEKNSRLKGTVSYTNSVHVHV